MNRLTAMRRRGNICVHDPPCCYSLQDPGTDSSSEFYLPRYKTYARKKRSAPLPNLPKHYKRKESQPPLKHFYPYLTSHRCSKVNYERPYSTTVHKGKHKGRRLDETSTDDKSLSGASHCTSALSVDVSCEMDAVNKEIEALLAGYEKALDDNLVEEVQYKMKIQGRDKGQQKPLRKSNLNPEQIRILSMERPPLDKLKEVPLEYLKPRLPSHIREKVLQVKKSLGLKNQNIEKKQPSGSAKPAATKNDQNASVCSEAKPSDSTTELLKTMWQEMVAQGLVPKDQEVGKTVKQIFTSMPMDDSSEIKIDLDGLSKTAFAKTAVPNARTTATSTVSCHKTSSSVATQTLCDYDELLSKKPQPPRNGMGDADRSGIDQKRNSELQNKKPAESNDVCFSEILKSMDEPNAAKNKLLMNCTEENRKVEKPTEFTTESGLRIAPEQTEFNIYTLQANTEKFENLRKNFDEWMKSKRNEPLLLGENNKFLDSFKNNREHNQKLELNSEISKIEEEIAKFDDPNPLSALKGTIKEEKINSSRHDLQGSLHNFKEVQNEQNGYKKRPSFQVSNGLIGNEPKSNVQGSLITKMREINNLRRTSVFNTNPQTGSEQTAERTTNLSDNIYNLTNKSDTFQVASSRFNDSFLQKHQKNTAFTSSLQEDNSLTSRKPDSAGNVKSNETEPLKKAPPNTQNNNTERSNVQFQGTEESQLGGVQRSYTPRENHERESGSSPGNTNLLLSTNSSLPKKKEQEEMAGTYTEIQMENNDLKDSNIRNAEKKKFKKENLDDLDSSICVEIIRKLIETMMKCEPGEMSNEISAGKNIMHHLKQLRSDHLKHIQTEVKHIEDLDRCLEDFGISSQLLYKASRPTDEKK